MTPHGPPASNDPQHPDTPSASAIKAMIHKRLTQGVSRHDLLDHLVDAQLKRSLGDRVTHAMRRQAVERFRTDPKLAALADALFASAAA